MGRDRHGRTRRGDGDPRRRPVDGWRTRDRGRFRQLVAEALGTLPPPVSALLAGARLTVADVPDEADGEPVVADAEGDGQRVRALVVYRRPAELRAADREDLVEIVREAVLEAVAAAAGADPDDWDGA